MAQAGDPQVSSTYIPNPIYEPLYPPQWVPRPYVSPAPTVVTTTTASPTPSIETTPTAIAAAFESLRKHLLNVFDEMGSAGEGVLELYDAVRGAQMDFEAYHLPLWLESGTERLSTDPGDRVLLTSTTDASPSPPSDSSVSDTPENDSSSHYITGTFTLE